MTIPLLLILAGGGGLIYLVTKKDDAPESQAATGSETDPEKGSSSPVDSKTGAPPLVAPTDRPEDVGTVPTVGDDGPEVMVPVPGDSGKTSGVTPEPGTGNVYTRSEAPTLMVGAVSKTAVPVSASTATKNFGTNTTKNCPAGRVCKYF